MLVLAGLGWFGWWAANRIDDRAIARETRHIQSGLAAIAAQMAVDQDSSIVWDDAVVNLRSHNGPWLADNIAEWMSEYYQHDLIYLLDPDNQPIRAVENGAEAATSGYRQDEAAIAPLVGELRKEMAEASAGEADSTQAITGLGILQTIALRNDLPSIVSIRPVLPDTDAVSQAPGQEFLHVSVRFIGPSVIQTIADQFEIQGLELEKVADHQDSKAALPLLTSGGRIVGFLAWDPEEPAYELLHDTAPVIAGTVLMVGLFLSLLLVRLRRTSSQLEDSKAAASFLAFHDPLTGIPNRALFEDRLEQALANMRRTGAKMARHYVDLDRFKHVNDTLGHPAGDVVIRETARRLSAQVDEVDTVARLGGDEFAVIQFAAGEDDKVKALGQSLVDCLAEPFDIEGQSAQLGASVGVVVVADGDTTAEELMREADMALYEAKDSGRGRYQLFAGELGEAVRERRELEMDLRAALNSGSGLELVYQPIYLARSEQLAGAEALVRWEHPTRGRLSPATFIGLAEERGLIDQLGLYVLREACRFAAQSSLPWVAVNVSPLQFRNERFAEHVLDVLAETGLAAKRLEIEITEGLLLQNSPSIQSALMKLRASGIRVALDDFGTGYSSISYLRSYGVDKLKIDQSFTAQLGRDGEIDSIVRSIIELGRAMHMTVTAEGVETTEQRDILQTMACDQLQGYLLSRPLTGPRLAELLDSNSRKFEQLRAG